MCQSDTYSSIKAASQGLFKDNGSRFIALAYPVESEQQVKALVDEAKKCYHDARHHCFAYRIGQKGDIWRASDDGEPSGSAGRQILGQIDSAGLSDVLVIVVRYFGGIKLGIPGLIRAYKTSTADALSSAEKCEKIAGDWYALHFTYEQMPSVMKFVKDNELPQRSLEMQEDCRMEVRVRKNLEQIFLENIEKMSNFKDKFIKL